MSGIKKDLERVYYDSNDDYLDDNYFYNKEMRDEWQEITERRPSFMEAARLCNRRLKDAVKRTARRINKN